MTKPDPKLPVHVWPVAGRFLHDVASVEHDCTDPFCVASGAFTDKPPDRPAKTKHQDPPDGGSLDSQEA